MIEQAYRLGEQLGLAVWCHDQAGPYQTVPCPGPSWQPVGKAARQPAEYVRNGTAKLLTLFHPADGRLHVKGVTSAANQVLHPWLKQELAAILATLPEPATGLDGETIRRVWERWVEGLSVRPSFPGALPPLRLLLVLDNLAGHKSVDLVLWFFAHGILPLYTPLGSSWLNMAESIQRILAGRALVGQEPSTPQEIMIWLEAVAEHWNRQPTPFEWGGKRAARRQRRRERYALGGSGACTRRPVRRRVPIVGNSYKHVK